MAVDAEYGQRYRKLHEVHWWWRAREQIVLGLVRDLAPPGGYGHILDIGCGDGLLFDRLASHGLVEGVEPDRRLVLQPEHTSGLIHLRPFDPTFDSGKRYGLVLMLDVLEHMDEPVAAVRNVARIMAPGGIFLVTVPAFLGLWTSHDVLNDHRTRYTRRRLESVLEAPGLQIQFSRYMFRWLTLAKLAVRAKEALFGGEPKTPVIPPEPVKRALLTLTNLEELMLGRLPLGFGSSNLAVERRRPDPTV